MSPQKHPISLSKDHLPSLLKLFACLVYELLTIVALCIVFAGVFYGVFGDATEGIKRLSQQMFLWTILGAYYVLCWTKTGQTLAMQSWHLKVVSQNNAPLSMQMALMRYVLASLSLVLLGLGFLWVVVDKNRLFLHDRLLKCKIVIA
ncbi:MAG: RDD family protein [Methylotenera sp.]|nr:RDD family protein [Methylotenera sp.]